MTRLYSYCDSVLAGTQPAPEGVKNAVKLFYHQLEQAKKGEYNYTFDESKVTGFLRFCSTYLRFHDGPKVGKPIELEGFQIFFISQILGWVDENGQRKVNNSLLMIPKKNGKTWIVACMVIYLMVQHRAKGAGSWKGYLVAENERQAKKGLSDVGEIVNMATSPLRKIFEIRTNLVRIAGRPIVFTVLPSRAKGLDGIQASLIVMDELWTQKDNALYQILWQGFGSIPNQLLMGISTAGPNLGFLVEHEKIFRENQKTEKELRKFGLLITPDEGDKWDDEKTWYKLNPLLGIGISIDQFRQFFNDALSDTSKMLDFKNKRLNFWLRSSYAWLQPDQYTPYFVAKDEAEFRGFPAYLSLDLSVSVDLSGYTLTVPHGDKFVTLFRFWILENSILHRTKVTGLDWKRAVEQGLIYTCPGDYINYRLIREQIKKDAEFYDVKELTFDPHLASQFANELSEEVIFPVIKQAQTLKDFGPMTQEFERNLILKRLEFQANELMAWTFGNAEVTKSDWGCKPRKPKQEWAHIDPIQCAVVSIYRAQIASGKPAETTRTIEDILYF